MHLEIIKSRNWDDDWYSKVLEIAKKLNRPICGAKNRKGEPCTRYPSHDGNGRCHYHGGPSTGTKTLEGKVKSALAVTKTGSRSVLFNDPKFMNTEEKEIYREVMEGQVNADELKKSTLGKLLVAFERQVKENKGVAAQTADKILKYIKSVNKEEDITEGMKVLIVNFFSSLPQEKQGEFLEKIKEKFGDEIEL